MSEHNMQQNILLTEFDLLTTRGATQMVKALIPYLSPSEQKMMGIMVRIFELIGTIKYYSCDKPPLCHKTPSGFSPNGINTEMINDIKKYCTPENQQMIDMLVKFMNAQEMMKFMNAFDVSDFPGFNKSDTVCDGNCENCGHSYDNKNSTIGNLFGMLNQSSLMNPGQLSLYQEYMNKLNDDFNDE